MPLKLSGPVRLCESQDVDDLIVSKMTMGAFTFYEVHILTTKAILNFSKHLIKLLTDLSLMLAFIS